jgi:hypothetical protein
VKDDSGTIDAMQWKDENAQSNEHIEENSYVRIIGTVRSVFLTVLSLIFS